MDDQKNEKREEIFVEKLYTGTTRSLLTFEGWGLLLELASPCTVVLIKNIPVFNNLKFANFFPTFNFLNVQSYLRSGCGLNDC